MTGINSNQTPPSFPPPGNIPPPAPQEPATTPTQLDRLSQGDSQTPLYLSLNAQSSVTLAPGTISLIELTKLINGVITTLREALRDQEYKDADINKKFHLAALATASDLIDEYWDVVSQVDAWNSSINTTGNQINRQHNVLEQKRQALISLMNQTAGGDNQAKDAINQYIDIYNNPAALQNFATSQGMTLQQAVDYINQQIGSYSQYMAGRPDVQASLTDYVNAAALYYNLIAQENSNINNINGQRTGQGLSQIDHLNTGTPPNGSLSHYMSGTLPNSLPTVSLPAGSTPISHINQTVTVTSTPPAIPFQPIPRCSYSEALAALWLPDALKSLAFISSFNRILDISSSFAQTQMLFYRDMGMSIISPALQVENAKQLFLDSVNGIGGGIGIDGFAFSLHSNNLAFLMSSAILRALSQEWSIPLTGRVFARLQFTALQLLQNSALLSPLPALRFIASSLGSLGSASPAINVAISLAITEQVLGLLGGGVLRNIVNAQMNRMPFFARMEMESSMNAVITAEKGLHRAVALGNPGMIREAIAELGNARTHLANANQLLNTFGALSIGGMGAFNSAVSATMSLSILTVALAQLGRSLGLPGIVPQMYAQLSGIPTIEILAAMSGGSRIIDVLDNPYSILALKETLVNTLVFQRGFNNVTAGLMVNSAIDNVILNGGVWGFSQLQAKLSDEFLAQGFNFFQAHMLANETVSLIRGDLGINFLSAAFGLNSDRSLVASSVVDNMLGIDRGVAGAMLSNAINRSLLMGGLGSTVALQGQLNEEFLKIGINASDASNFAHKTAEFIGAAGVVVPFNSYPGVASLLLGNDTLQAISSGSPAATNQLRNKFISQGLDYFHADFLASQVSSLSARTFTTPGNLFEVALEAAVGRAGTSFQTQREFRDAIFNELKGVGFNSNDAMYLANSAAAFGLNGSLTPLFGVSPETLSSIGSQVTNRILNDLHLSLAEAEAIYSQAERRTLSDGPFSSRDQFQTVLKEEVFRAIHLNTGSTNGNDIFDHAVADLAKPGQLLSLAGLTEQISNAVLGLVKPDAGSRLAQEIKDQILLGLLGGTTVDEIETPERKNPLSILNQMNDSLNILKSHQDEDEIRKTIKMLMQLLRSMLTPNAEIGFLLQTLSDGPSTFIGNILGPQQPKGEFLQMQA